MSTMTTTQRYTQALNLAPTQNKNTAPVFEFECLFTHDLRKKKKTWHDGCLRFHTFNRRVMVYDDSKNFIGDLHYRDTDELQEGEELRLDKGVLVNVGRRTGQTETDLAEVMEKARHGDEGGLTKQATPAATYQTMQRVPSANIRERPKSLAAVLGVSQGRIGRARLATRSPYEQLHTVRTPAPALGQPPAKRQRIASDKENTPSLPKFVSTEQQDGGRPPPSFSPSLPRAPLAARKEVNIPKAVIDISSEEEDPLSPLFLSAFESSRSRQKATKVVRNPPVKLDLAPKPFKPQQKAVPKLLSVIQPPAVTLKPKEKQGVARKSVAEVETRETSSKAQRKQKAPTKPNLVDKTGNLLSKSAATRQKARAKPAAVAEQTTLSKNAPGKRKESTVSGQSARLQRLYSGPTASLRFAPHKPITKLMYKALLPSSFVASRPGSSNSTNAVSAQADLPADVASESGIFEQQSRRPKDWAEEDVFDLSSLESTHHIQQQALAPAKSPPKPVQLSPAREVSSPLFCSQSPTSVVPDPLVIKENSNTPSPMKTPPPNPRNQKEQPIDDDPHQDPQTPVVGLDPASQIRPLSKLTLMDQRLMMPPPRIQPPSSHTEMPRPPVQQPFPQVRRAAPNFPPDSPQPRPFRRVLSESDSPVQVNMNAFVSPPPRTPSILTGMQQRSNAQAVEPQRLFKSPAKLQRSHSDTAAMLQIEKLRPIGKINVDPPEIVDEEEDKDVGPWSSREAFLLFDWWPHGREKPDYGTVKPQQHQEQQSFSGFMHPRNAESFGETLGVIRDGVDI